MSRQLKLTLFLLAFNIIGFAEDYLLRDMARMVGPSILIATALGAVLASRRWLRGRVADSKAAFA
jgi:hypothetical protein